MRYLLFVALLFCIITANSQIYKFRAIRVGIKEESKNSDTTTKWQKCDYLIVFQTDKINLYWDEEEQFDIIKVGPPIITSKIIVYACNAIDDEGRKCMLMYFLWPDEPGKNSVLIKYPTFTYYFDVQKIN